jgi:hypothetical protein
VSCLHCDGVDGLAFPTSSLYFYRSLYIFWDGKECFYERSVAGSLTIRHVDDTIPKIGNSGTDMDTSLTQIPQSYSYDRYCTILTLYMQDITLAQSLHLLSALFITFVKNQLTAKQPYSTPTQTR